ncbi:hypothetical protein C3747_92g73 [Trypanosoma cruzi]|uniref:MORN repeat-containing protein 5 n=2 Tax=Trypanosoma cruzi TaxID=5693 RepID=Q4DQT2_TRYCC|nr:hypothetical protein, conserved [Trypanosoma cruzi]EAN94895.1 hypothetical protein, conserved [Trypanosoma cruzi]PWV08250.1 hypothetical protein C3747_92g73 [Trypanosoma cruzi]RNC49591.1 hypothetical protein TcCL_NonESM00454 [Trypanosoma cruzi]|eukprot:XP_816746.1 hypothetical protein [Trypanosoma cruzi strain CL Brener]
MFYTSCSYQGERTPDGKRFHEQGIYTFANGDTYVGAFNDGRMHGHGTLFFTAERGGGQYRGVWENGRNVSGAFVFADGLVYGSGEDTTTTDNNTAAAAEAENTATVTRLADTTSILNSGVKGGMDGHPISSNSKRGKGNVRESLAEEWLYCREGDRRLWAEHLREVMPVLPMQAVLGGVRVPQSSLWAVEPVVAPSVAAEAKIPATFVQGQPRSLADVPAHFWKDPQQRENVMSSMRLPTPPFKGAQGGAGREETMVDNGDRPAINLSLRIIAPLESEAMRRAIAAAVAASARAATSLEARKSPQPESTLSPDSAGCLVTPGDTDVFDKKGANPELALQGTPVHLPGELEGGSALRDDECSTVERHASQNTPLQDPKLAPCQTNEPSLAPHPLQGLSVPETPRSLTEFPEEVTCRGASEARVDESAPSPVLQTVMYAYLSQEQPEPDAKQHDEFRQEEEEQDTQEQEHYKQDAAQEHEGEQQEDLKNEIGSTEEDKMYLSDGNA